MDTLARPSNFHPRYHRHNNGLYVPTSASAYPGVAGYDYWFDASDAATITSASNKVSQLNDKSVNAWHMTQAVDANRVKTGLSTQNGLNLIETDADNQFIMKTGLATTNQGTYFLMFKCASSFEGPIWIQSNAGITAFADLAAKVSTNEMYIFDGNTHFITGSYPSINGTAYIGTYVCNAASSALYRNNSAALGTGTCTSAACDRFGFPHVTGYVNRVKMGEIIHYPTALSDADRAIVVARMNAKWVVF